jgi:hypothetical protein
MIDEIADEMEAAGIDLSACLPMLARAASGGAFNSGLRVAMGRPRLSLPAQSRGGLFPLKLRQLGTIRPRLA